MPLPHAFVEEQERRKQLLSAAASGSNEAQKELHREYRVRVLSAEERANYKYVEIKPSRFLDLYGPLYSTMD
jgi:hypothetical protein